MTKRSRNERSVHLTKGARKRRSVRVKSEEVDRCSIFRVQKIGAGSESYGGVAQLGEHLPCKQGVKSSNLFISTSGWENQLGETLNGLIAQQARALA